MHKDGIVVAEYWTELLPKKEMENKLYSLWLMAEENVERINYLKIKREENICFRPSFIHFIATDSSHSL